MIEVGMYIRINSFISKIGHINTSKKGNTYIQFKQPNGLLITMNTKQIGDEVKMSFNIIDLLEPMDLMYIDISPDNYGGIVVPRVAETLNELDKWKEKFINGSYILKGVITHEQLKNGTYWIGGN